ncbi:MAG: alpha/beta hydrolase [Actinobacteria bacterium]|nr:alpha/beta hydrolase [Actinomycetota bacterium]
MPIVLLAAAAGALLSAVNASLRRPRRFGPLWLPAMVTGETAPWGIALRLGIGAAFAAAGWAGGWAGRTGLALLGISAALLAVNHAAALRARALMAAAASEALGEPVTLPPTPWWRLLRPYPSPPRRVRVERDVSYGPERAHRMDVYRPASPAGPGPVLVQVHGGGWTHGRRDQQARPLLHRMAAAGWVVCSISYRLTPPAVWPEHLVDVKRAIAYVREHAAGLGADASFVAVTGGSAGGQLAAMAALTAGNAGYQPGFEEADTAVQACVPVYGVHDMLRRDGITPKWPYLATHVLRSDPVEDPERWASASPIRSARAERPPFLIVHGAADTLVGPGESERLADALRAAGGPPVGLAVLPGATHGFDVMHSLRAERTVDGVQAFLEGWWRRHRAAGDGP